MQLLNHSAPLGEAKLCFPCWCYLWIAFYAGSVKTIIILSEKAAIFTILTQICSCRTAMERFLKLNMALLVKQSHKTAGFSWLQGSPHEVGVKWQDGPAKGHHDLPWVLICIDRDNGFANVAALIRTGRKEDCSLLLAIISNVNPTKYEQTGGAIHKKKGGEDECFIQLKAPIKHLCHCCPTKHYPQSKWI